MKFLILAALCLCVLQDNKVVKSIDIDDSLVQEDHIPGAEERKPGDVLVLRTDELGERTYAILYYHDYTGEVREYRALIQEQEAYLKADYYWDSDTSIVITMYPSKRELVDKLRLTGVGARSSMQVVE